VTFPLYPASSNLEIMLSTSRVLLAEAPSASGLGDVDKLALADPGPAERFALGEVEKAEGGGGDEDLNGLLLLRSVEAMIVWVVGMLVDTVEAFDPILPVEVVVLRTAAVPSTGGTPVESSGDAAVGGGDLLLPEAAAPAAAAPEETLPLPRAAGPVPLPFLAPGVLTSRGAELESFPSGFSCGMTRLPAIGGGAEDE
jgi:hypothetical protein